MGLNREANLAMLAIVASELGALRNRVVFVGGSITGFLVTDSAAADVRSTIDVDLLVEAVTSLDFHAIEAEMRGQGFQPDVESGIRCRWKSRGVIVDLMPSDESILGFSNRWYSDAIMHAVAEQLPGGSTIKRVTAPYFIATKIEAFKDRGNGDYEVSHDFEDIVTVVDGRRELRDEIAVSEPELRSFICATFAAWIENRDFLIALSGQLPPDSESQKRLGVLQQRFMEIASIQS